MQSFQLVILRFATFVTKSGSLNFLEPSKPVQAYNGTALLYLIRVCTTFVISSLCFGRNSAQKLYEKI